MTVLDFLVQPNLLSSAKDYFEETKQNLYLFSILVVDDNSSDLTHCLIKYSHYVQAQVSI